MGVVALSDGHTAHPTREDVALNHHNFFALLNPESFSHEPFFWKEANWLLIQ